MAKLPQKGDTDFLENEWTIKVLRSLTEHLLRPFRLAVDRSELLEFADELLRYPFLLRDITGRDHLPFSPSKIEEKWGNFDEDSLLRLCGFMWQSPFFTDSLKDQLLREVSFHLANNKEGKLPDDVIEDYRFLRKSPQGKLYQDYIAKFREWRKLPKGYLFDQKRQLTSKFQHFSRQTKDGPYFNSDAVALFASDVHDKIGRLSNQKQSSSQIAKKLAEFVSDFYNIKGRGIDLNLSTSYFKKAIQSPPTKSSELLDQLPRFSKLKISVTTR